MSQADRPQSRTATLHRVRPSRAAPAVALPQASMPSESLTPFCGFAAAMAELARRPQDRRIISGA